MEPNVSIVILNWNGWKDTLECLESLFQIDYRNYNVIIVDNGSTDDSLEKIREYFDAVFSDSAGSLNVKEDKCLKLIEIEEENVNSWNKLGDISNLAFLIKNKVNHGFAKGSNIGIKFALNLNPDYVLLLNNDTVVEKNFLSRLIEEAEKNQDIGIIGPVNYFYDKPDEIQFLSATINFNRGTITLHLDKNLLSQGLVETDYVQGSCFMIRTEVIYSIGLLNSAYFCYWEETDYCVRARRAGFRVVCCTSSSIWHKIGRSSLNMPGFTVYYLTRNKFLFMRAHARNFYKFLLYFFLFGFWWDLLALIKNGSPITPFFRGIYHGLLKSRIKSKT